LPVICIPGLTRNSRETLAPWLARHAPLLVLRGATSDVLDQPTLRRMSSLRGNVRTVEIPGVGHAPTLDEPASREALAEFLARVP
jgi:pimeloyl-ACP methyl ester carboxylesterase